MATRRNSFRMDHPVITTILILAIVAFMYFAGEVLKPLALAVLLSFAITPLVRRLERAGLPRTPAVLLSVVVSMGLLGAVCAVVWNQLAGLTGNIDTYRANIHSHISELIEPEQDASTLQKLNELGESVTSQIMPEAPAKDAAAARERPQKVEVVQRVTFQERLQQAVGPILEPLAVGFLVLILVLFILMNREDLGDRMIRLFGSRRISLTTRTMGEIGARISRYLATFTLVNSTFGLIIGLGLWLIGLPYAVLWGFLAAALRFIPYVGPATAFALPVIFSFASTAGNDWWTPLMVVTLFGVMELVANSFLEPIIYGRTTGVSALGLLVAAMFWTWLWGALGLLLSTPLTVCLAVVGKYVPSLGAFATLLGEEAELDPDVRYYQRLVSLDPDGAAEFVEEALARRPRAEVFDTILIPALARAERDYQRGEIDDQERAFVWRVTGDVLESQEGTEQISLETVAAAPTPANDTATAAEAAPTPSLRLLGLAADDRADLLTLRMLAQLLGPSGRELEIVTGEDSMRQVLATVAADEPDLIVLSHLPPYGLTPARYLVRRLRALLPGCPILVGRWGDWGDTEAVSRKLKEAGATSVAFRLQTARDQVLELAGRLDDTEPAPAAPPSPAAARLGS